MISSTEQYKTSIVGKSRRIYIRAVVDISDPDMTITGVDMSSQTKWSKPEELYDKDFSNPARYATLERNRWLLDGTFGIFPDNFQVPEKIGAATDELSGDDGSFFNDQTVEITFSNVSILQAFTVTFSGDEADGVAADFTAEVYYNDTAYYTQEVTGNTESQVTFSGFTVYDPTSIKLTITKWSLPGRRVRMVEIFPGIYEEWSEKMLASFEATHQADFSCLTLPFGTVKLTMNNKDRRFEPRNKAGVFQSIEERQGIEVYIGVRLPDKTVEYKQLGIFYQSGDGWKTSNNSISMDWSLVDIVGLLVDRTFIPPDTLPTTLEGWIAAVVAQLGDNFANRYHVDPDYAALSVTANSVSDVTGKSCRDIIRWACMTTGTWPRADAETGDLTAEPLWNQGNKVQLTALVNYPTMKANESIAALIFNLADGNNTEYVVSGNSTSSEKTVTVQNPFIHTTDQALSAARLILSCYGGNLIETSGRGDPSSEIGDVDTIWLDESSATTARRKVQTFNFSNGVMQGCTSRLLQADGSYLYEEFAVIVQSGTWKAPAGVTQLRVVIGQGGQGGGYGEDGYVGGSGILPGQGVSAGYGENGAAGQGGKVWFGVININPEQEFTVTIGAGGAAATTQNGQPGAMGQESYFGTYTSANGQLYPNGYTDIANGNSFARTGVASPLPGSSDGGAGGKGGEPGSGYWEDVFGPEGQPWGWDFVITKQPGPGFPGVAGGSGFVMVTWDKDEVSA